MSAGADLINLSINSLAFYWSFPEIVAKERRYYEDEGIDVLIHDATPREKVKSKSEMYMGLQGKGLSDVYHAAEYVSISRAAGSETAKIVAFSPWTVDALNGSFGLYVRADSGIRNPQDLDGKVIGVEEATGSYYTTVEDLEPYIPKERIRLRKMGDPHDRLLSVWRGNADAGSLLGVYADLADHVGLVKAFQSKRRRGTLMVAKNDIPAETLAGFIEATNRAVRSINEDPDAHRARYFEMFKRILERFPEEIKKEGLQLRETIRIPRWAEWQSYPRASFEEIYRWMVERQMVQAGYSFENMVDLKAFKSEERVTA